MLLSAALAFSLAGAANAGADPRFGDSTWVAPGIPIANDDTTVVARVAPPDHERRWETALRFPFRVAFFPLRLGEKGIEAAADRIGDRVAGYVQRRSPSRGFSVAPTVDLSGPKDIGVGPAFRFRGIPPGGATVSLSGTWSPIDHRRVRFIATIPEGRTLSFRLRANYDARPNRRFAGIGNDTPEEDISYFRLDTTVAEGAVLIGASPLRQLRIVTAFSNASPRRGSHGSPLLEKVFPAGVPYGGVATKEFTYGVTGDFASLDDPRDPSLGFHGRIDLEHAIGARDRDPDYNQWLVEGRAYAPVLTKHRVIAVRLVYTGVRPTGGTSTMPFYRLITSDGGLRFAGYAPDRFHDRQLVLAHIEYRWMIWKRLNALALYQLGEVAPRASAFTLPAAHASWGGGFRIGTSPVTAIRLDVGKSVEGVHARLRLGSDF